MPAYLTQLVTDYHLNTYQFMQNLTDLTSVLVNNLNKLPNRILVVSPILFTVKRNNPYKFHSIITDIQRYKPDEIVLINWAEPHWITNHHELIKDVIEPAGIPYKLFGFYKAPGAIFFDFWAICFSQFMPDYQDEQLWPIAPGKVFLNHNRSIRGHRIQLYNKLKDANLLDDGHISYYLVKALPEDLSLSVELWPRNSKRDNGPLFNVPNDPYTLGDLSVWQDHIITVVSDGWWVEKPTPLGAVFLTEKVYKPIIGLRPFLYNGSYANFLELKNQGFDTFEDVFGLSSDDFSTVQRSHDSIVTSLQTLSSYTIDERIEWFNNLRPRLLANKEHFFKYVQYNHELLNNYAS